MWTAVNLKVLNTNLTGFSFSQNLLSILGNFELIDLPPKPPPPRNHQKIREFQEYQSFFPVRVLKTPMITAVKYIGMKWVMFRLNINALI